MEAASKPSMSFSRPGMGSAVTVVITSYHQGPFIREAVESALAQTVRPGRVIVVDDGSDDPASIAMLDELATLGERGKRDERDERGERDERDERGERGKRDAIERGDTNPAVPRIDIIRQPNAGPSAARNRGIAASETPFVVVLDGDDHLLPTFIERTLPLMVDDESTVAASGWLRTFGVLDSVVRPTGGDAAAFVSHNCCPATCMIRRSAWERCGGYDESMRSGFEDWDFFLSLLSRDDAPARQASCPAHIAIVSEPLIEYRTAPASSNVVSMTKRLDLMRFLIDKHRDLYVAHLADAVLGVEAISMSRLAMWEGLMRGEEAASRAFMDHPTYGDGGMAAAVRLRSCAAAPDSR